MYIIPSFDTCIRQILEAADTFQTQGVPWRTRQISFWGSWSWCLYWWVWGELGNVKKKLQTPSIQVLIYHSPAEETRLLGEMASSKTRAGNNTRWAWSTSKCSKLRKCSKKAKSKGYTDEYTKGHGANWKSSQWPKLAQLDKVNRVLNYDSNYKINIHESTLKWIDNLKNLPAKKETQVPSLGQEDPLEKGMATHSSILAWRIPWTEEPGRLKSIGWQRAGHDWVTNAFTFNKQGRIPNSLCSYST